MAKKSAISGEFIVTINDNNSVSVSKINKNTKEALREIAKAKGFEVDPKWTTNELGRKLLVEFCDGKNKGTLGEYEVERDANQKINVIKTFYNTKEGLRLCADSIGFPYENEWTTQQFGKKLVDHIESSK